MSQWVRQFWTYAGRLVKRRPYGPAHPLTLGDARPLRRLPDTRIEVFGNKNL